MSSARASSCQQGTRENDRDIIVHNATILPGIETKHNLRLFQLTTKISLDVVASNLKAETAVRMNGN